MKATASNRNSSIEAHYLGRLSVRPSNAIPAGLSPCGSAIRIAAIVVVILMLTVTPGFAQAPTGGSTVHRGQDPVVLPGNTLSLVNSAAIADVRLYAFDGTDWVALPFQVDEVSAGLYVTPGTDPDDGATALLDDNDQLVFMGFDAGVTASCEESFGLVGGPHLRERVMVRDPLTGDEGFAYLFVQPTLPSSPTSYVDWSPLDQEMIGAYNASYDLIFGSVRQPPFVGIADLSPNGGPDILDRMKTFVDVDAVVDIGLGCGFGLPISLTLDEETLLDEVGLDPTVSFTSVGAVRAVQQEGQLVVYGSRFDISTVFDLAALEQPPICPDTLTMNVMRVSLDLINPTGHGIDTYFDSNGTTASIDGSPDAVATDPVPNWFQVSGGAAGLGGLVQVISGFDAGTGTAHGFYLDDVGAGGTGDGSSFGEFGQEILSPGAGSGISVMTSTYILPPGTDIPVGETYLAGAITPLEGTSVIEDCTSSEPPEIFDDGFDSGDTSAWSSTVG